MAGMDKSRIGAMNLIYQHHSLDHMLDSFDRIGVRCFELWAPCEHFDLRMPSLASTAAFRRKLDSRGFSLTCVTPEQCGYPHNIASSNRDVRRYAVEHFKKYIDAAAQLGADKMLCGAGWGNVDEDLDEAWKRSVESLHEMVDHARQAGIKLAFEILNHYETNLVYDLETMKRMAQEITDPVFQFCVDTVPVELDGKKLSDFFDALGERIIHIHMTDGDPMGHVPPGLGQHDMQGYFRTLEGYGYSGYVTIEICDTAWSNDPEKATRIGYENLCKALDEAHQ